MITDQRSNGYQGY